MLNPNEKLLILMPTTSKPSLSRARPMYLKLQRTKPKRKLKRKCIFTI